MGGNFMEKTPKQLERYFKGSANHRRIEILQLLEKQPNVSLDDISESLGCNFKTIHGHTKSLLNAGLIRKEYRGRIVVHSLSPYGKSFCKFMRTF